MSKLWVGSLYYFLNVLLHIGVFGILFFVSAPFDAPTLSYITELWHSAEGRELIIFNTSLLIANLIFALSILFLAPHSKALLIIMAVIAWIGLVFAYLSETVGLVAYAAGAIHLTMVSFYRLKTGKN